MPGELPGAGARNLRAAGRDNEHLRLCPSNRVAQRDDRLQCFDHGPTVVLLLWLRELTVRNQVRVVFLVVIAHRPSFPTVVDALQRPVVVIAFGKMLD